MFKPFHQHIILIGLSTLLAVFSAMSIVWFTDPQTAGALTFTFFYASFFLAALGMAVIVGLIIRQLLFPGLYVTHLSNAFRQASLVAVLITSSLILQAQRLLYWWVEGSLILLIVAVEIFLSLGGL